MSAGRKLFILTALLYVSSNVLSMTSSVIFERVSVDYVNEDYITGVKMNIRKYDRTSGYFLNMEGTFKHTWGNNISLHIVFYEYLHNEYRRTFVEFHFKHGCDMLKSDPYFGKAIANTGSTCPAPPGFYQLANVTIPCEDFPNIWPFERAKSVTTVTCDNVLLLNSTLYMKFVQKKKNSK